MCESTLPETKKTVYSIPSGEGKDSLCTVPTGQGEDSLCIQSQSVFIPDHCFLLSSQPKPEVLMVGSRIEHFLSEWENQKAHRSILSLIQDRYKLPFREHPKLSRLPCIISGYVGSDKQSALLTSIQYLLQKGAIKVMHTKNYLGFYSRLFLVHKPGNCWRPVINLSSLNKFLAIPKWKPQSQYVPPSGRESGLHP